MTLRSRFPEGVRQELRGVLLGYNLIRLEMLQIAQEAEVEPTRISFTSAICIIDMQIRGYALSGDGTIPQNYGLCEKMLSILFCLKKENTERFHVRCFIYRQGIR